MLYQKAGMPKGQWRGVGFGGENGITHFKYSKSYPEQYNGTADIPTTPGPQLYPELLFVWNFCVCKTEDFWVLQFCPAVQKNRLIGGLAPINLPRCELQDCVCMVPCD